MGKRAPHISEVVRVQGRPAYSEAYMQGRNRIDVLYYQPAWNKRQHYYDRRMIRYTFRNSYLHQVKEVKPKKHPRRYR